MKRVLTTEQAIAIIDQAMVSRGITDEARTVWRMLRAELLQCREMRRIVRKMQGDE